MDDHFCEIPPISQAMNLSPLSRTRFSRHTTQVGDHGRSRDPHARKKTAMYHIDCTLTPVVDGEDVSDIWFGADRERSKPLYWRTSSAGASPAMREGKWKLHLGSRKIKDMELYDLSVDPSESQNVADQYPNVLTKLKAKFEAWVAELPKQYEKKKGKEKGKR